MTCRSALMCAVVALAGFLANAAPTARGEEWVAASSFEDPESKWLNETKAYDLSTSTYAEDRSNRTGWGAVLKLNYATPVTSDRVRVSTDFGFNVVDKVKLKVTYNDDTSETKEYDGTVVQNISWSTLTFTKGSVKSVEYSYHYLATGWYFWLYELQLYRCPPDPDPLGGQTLDPSSVNATSAVLHGKVVSNGGAPCYGRFKYWVSGGSAQYTGWRSDLGNNQEYTAAITGLFENHSYSYQAQLSPNSNPTPEQIVTCDPVKTFTTVKVTEQTGPEWVSPSLAWSEGSTWASPLCAMDDDTATVAQWYHNVGAGVWSPFLHLSTDLQSNGIRLWIDGTNTDMVDIDILRDGAWAHFYEGVFTGGAWQQFPFDRQALTEVRIRLRCSADNIGAYLKLAEADFHQGAEIRTTRYFVGPGSAWSSSANWSASSGGTGGASVPGTGCVAVFDANSPSCALSGNIAVEVLRLNSGFTGSLDTAGYSIVIERNRGFGELRVAGGELKLGSATHTIRDNLRYLGGTITPGTSTVELYAPTDGSFAVDGAFELANVHLCHSGTGSTSRRVTLNGQLTVTGTCTLDGYESGGHQVYLEGSGCLIAKGSIVGNGKVIRGTANLTVAGASGDQTQTNLHWGTSGTYTVDKPSGTLIWAGTVEFGDPTTSSAADTKLVLNTVVDAVSQQQTVWLCGYGSGDVKITGNLTAYNVTFYRPGGTGTSVFDLGTNTLTVENALTLDLVADGGWKVIFGEGGTIACKGSVTATSVANADWSGVDFLVNGSGAQSVGLGGLAIYSMKVDKPSGAVTFTSGFTSKHELEIVKGNTVNFGAGAIFAAKSLVMNGETGNVITLRSTSEGTAWKLNVTDKYQTPVKVDVKDSDASGGQEIVATGCTDSGGCTNWRFVDGVFVSFKNGTTSVTSPAWVYGECGPNVTSVQLKVNGGTAFDVVRTSTMKWFADDSSTSGKSIGIGLSATAATGLEVIGKDAQNNQQSATQSVTWTPTDIGQSGSVTIRKGDSLLLTAGGTGTLEIDANGDSTIDYTGTAGDKFPYQYSTPGVYSATAKVAGQTVGTVQVTVVEAVLPALLACQRNETITRKILVTPAAQAANLTVNLSDDGTVGITTEVVSDGINVTFSATDIVAPRIFVRLGGAEGPVLATDMVKPFKITYLGPDVPKQEDYADGDSKYALTIKLEPFVAGAKLQFATYSGGATFENGSHLMQKMTDDIGAGPYTFFMYSTRNWGVTCHNLYVIP